MKKTTKDYTLLALAIPFFIALIASGAFSGCGDHYSPLDTYIEGQIQKSKDSARYVTNWKGQIDSVLLNNNQ